MSLVCSWIAVKGAAVNDLLAAVGMEETSIPMEVVPGCREVNLSYRALPDGWTVFFAENFDWADNKTAVDLSRLGSVVGCQYEDQVYNASVATGAEGGVELWCVSANYPGRPRLDVRGSPPTEFASIRERLSQEDEDFKGAGEIPTALAKAICGFDVYDRPIDETFIALKPIGAPDEQAEYGWRPGRWRRKSKPGNSPVVEAKPPRSRPPGWRKSPHQAEYEAYIRGERAEVHHSGRGWSASWIAVKDAPLNAVLKAARFRPSRVYKNDWCPHGQVPHAYVEMPDGWTVLLGDDGDWATRARILRLSRLGPTVALTFAEAPGLESIATGAENGSVLWRVSHNDGLTRPTLSVQGAPPPAFSEIRDRLCRQQEAHGGDNADTDFIHDVPILTAQAACGFNLDQGRWKYRSLEKLKPWPIVVLKFAVGLGELPTSPPSRRG